MKKLDSHKQENDNNRVRFRGMILPLVVSAVLLGIWGISYIRSNFEAIYPIEQPEVSRKDALKWHNAVINGKEKEAILFAAKIIRDDSPVLPDPDFIQQVKHNGLGTLILTSPFNHFDYLRWKDAQEISRIGEQYRDLDEPVTEFFREVMTKKKPVPDGESLTLREMFHIKVANFKEKPYASIFEIWEKGYASFDELARLFCAIAYHSGYDVQVVAFYNESWKLEHMVCELRKNEKSYVADFINNKVWSDTTVSELLSDKSNFQGIWSEKVIKALNRRTYMLPAEAMDYRLINMQLYSRLKELGLDGIPRFGENPKGRIDDYIQKYQKKSEKSHHSYWNFPFKSLMSSPNFPTEWKLPPARPEEKVKVRGEREIQKPLRPPDGGTQK